MLDILRKVLVEAETKKIMVVDHHNHLLASINSELAMENTKKVYGHLQVLRVGMKSGFTAVQVQR